MLILVFHSNMYIILTTFYIIYVYLLISSNFLTLIFAFYIFRQRDLYVKYYLPWAIQTGLNSNFMLNIYFEKRWEQPIDEIHKELNIKPLEINSAK